jgi:hypothetical protein
MSSEQDKNPETASFKVNDKRAFREDGTPRDAAPEAPVESAKPAPSEAQKPKKAAVPAIDFGTFLFSLSTSALVHMGEVADPGGEEHPINLTLAKQTIDIISMLKEKTKGNLSPDEQNLIDHLLYDLRMRFVAKAKTKG